MSDLTPATNLPKWTLQPNEVPMAPLVSVDLKQAPTMNIPLTDSALHPESEKYDGEINWATEAGTPQQLSGQSPVLKYPLLTDMVMPPDTQTPDTPDLKQVTHDLVGDFTFNSSDANATLIPIDNTLAPPKAPDPKTAWPTSNLKDISTEILDPSMLQSPIQPDETTQFFDAEQWGAPIDSESSRLDIRPTTFTAPTSLADPAPVQSEPSQLLVPENTTKEPLKP